MHERLCQLFDLFQLEVIDNVVEMSGVELMGALFDVLASQKLCERFAYVLTRNREAQVDLGGLQGLLATVLACRFLASAKRLDFRPTDAMVVPPASVPFLTAAKDPTGWSPGHHLAGIIDLLAGAVQASTRSHPG